MVELRIAQPGGGTHTVPLSWSDRELTGDLADHFDPVRTGVYTLTLAAATGRHRPPPAATRPAPPRTGPG